MRNKRLDQMKKFLGLGMKVKGYCDDESKLISQLSQNKKYKAIESFCGPGGMSLGLHWAGFDIRYSFDFDAKSVDTHNKNIDGLCEILDAKNATGLTLMSKAGLAIGETDLFAGGPPCQGFSKQKRGAHHGDERNGLVLEYVRLVKEIQPRYFIFENVAVFGQARGKKYLKEMIEKLSDYEFSPAFYNSADYGVPQTRERFILVGNRKDQLGKFQIPKPTVKKWLTVGEVLEGLDEPPADFSEHPIIFNHQKTKLTQINIERFSYVPQGGGWKDIPNELRLACHRDVDTSAGGWPDVYGRLRSAGQCPTITGGFDSFTRGRYGHPLQNRAITPREAARLQGFPDDFIFQGNRGDVRSQIGNVVPPPLAEAVGLAVKKALLISDGLIEQRPAKKSEPNDKLKFEFAY